MMQPLIRRSSFHRQYPAGPLSSGALNLKKQNSVVAPGRCIEYSLCQGQLLCMQELTLCIVKAQQCRRSVCRYFQYGSPFGRVRIQLHEGIEWAEATDE